MYRLVYISTPKPGLRSDDVAGILAASRKNNVENAVTGLLVQDERRFLQYLEGEQTQVDETFARIATDTRHSAIIPLKIGYIGRRQFPNWGMASKTINSPGSLRQAVAEMTGGCDPEVADELLRFADARDRAA